ncbi:alpha/beta hydrolase [Mucilaginibacter sp.]|uniref:alpha/beta fold hydrolase n=1 Tax=Mucilaginibacter sp. TaxID=1882438 RepID=UPI0026333A13|nr:alpha/beta hydrolase [Mucilaginibacter sp.]MDB4923782.1 alpha/beta hydrolase fold protein [Mucilaginibacter sp.]
MKNRRLIQLMKSAVAVLLLGLGIVFVSCKKDSIPVKTPVGVTTDHHQTAVTQFVTAGGTKFAYRVLGDKPGIPLVMLSPLGSSMDDWDPAITNGLAQKYKVIIFDIQGVGTSGGTTPDNIPDMAKGIASFIKALGYSKVNLMGFSMGSFISQQIVLTEPGLVNKIILTGTGPKGSQGLSNLPNILASAAGLSPEQVFLASFFASSAASQSAGKSAYERVQERQVDRDTPLSGESFTAEVKAVLGWAQPYPDALKELQSVTQPVLIAQGQEDILVPVVNAINMSKSLPNARLTVYPDAGHAAFFQYHDDFVQKAIEFLGK